VLWLHLGPADAFSTACRSLDPCLHVLLPERRHDPAEQKHATG
jgi:hypothetical protein